MKYAIRLGDNAWWTGGHYLATSSNHALQFSNKKDAELMCIWVTRKGGFTQASVEPTASKIN